MKFWARWSKFRSCAAFSGVRAGVFGLGGSLLHETSAMSAKEAAGSFSVVICGFPFVLRMVTKGLFGGLTTRRRPGELPQKGLEIALVDGEGDNRFAAGAVGGVAEGEDAAVGLGDLAAEDEPDAGAAALGGEKRDE